MSALAELSFEIGGHLQSLLRKEPRERQAELMAYLEAALEDGGISISMCDMNPLEYCEQLFWHFSGNLSPLLREWARLNIDLDHGSAEELIDQLVALLPSAGHGE